MAKFIGIINSENGGKVTRLGNKYILVHANGWNHGITIRAFIDEDGNETFRIIKNSGSSGSGEEFNIGIVRNGKFIPNDNCNA